MIKSTITIILSYFAPIATIIHVMIVFIMIDLLSGIWVYVKTKECKELNNNKLSFFKRFAIYFWFIWFCIESKKLRRTLTKIFWYMVSVMMAHMMEVTFSLQFLHLAQVIGGFICMVELKSVFENITKITNEPVFMKIYKLFEKKSKEAIDFSVAERSQSDRNDSDTVNCNNKSNL